MAGKASPALELTDRQYKLLAGHIRRRDTKNHELKRVKIILKASKGQSTFSISKEIGLGVGPVSTWRKRWAACYEHLVEYERGKSGEGVKDKDLLREMLAILKDRPRSGSPPRFSLSQKQQIVALACRKPSEYGIAISRWTHEMLAHVAQAENIVESISPRHVGKILKKAGLTSA